MAEIPQMEVTVTMTDQVSTALRQAVADATLDLLRQVQARDADRLSFDAIRIANKSRVVRWHGPAGLADWSPLEWAGAMTGEAGEAANKAKKLLRLLRGTPGSRNPATVEIAREELAEECADTFIYLDLLCASQGIDLEGAIRATFNSVSEREGFPERL